MRRAATGQTDAAERDCVTAHRKRWAGLSWAELEQGQDWVTGRTGLLSTSPRFWMLDQPLQSDIWGRQRWTIMFYNIFWFTSKLLWGIHMLIFLTLWCFQNTGHKGRMQYILHNTADVPHWSFKIQRRTIIADFVHVSNFIKSDQQWHFVEGQSRSHHTGSLNRKSIGFFHRPLDFYIK